MGFKRISRDGDIFKIEVDGELVGSFEVKNNFGACSIEFKTNKNRVYIKHKKGSRKNVNADNYFNIHGMRDSIFINSNPICQQQDHFTNRKNTKIYYRRNKKGSKRD